MSKSRPPPPRWFCCSGAGASVRQVLLRRWQQVKTTGRTKRGNGWRVGETHHRAKLTDHDVELMRVLHDGGMNCSEIARKFDCARTTVSSIVNYRHRVKCGEGENLVFE